MSVDGTNILKNDENKFPLRNNILKVAIFTGNIISRSWRINESRMMCREKTQKKKFWVPNGIDENYKINSELLNKWSK